MFYYWFIDLFCMFTIGDFYDVDEYTLSYWRRSAQLDREKFSDMYGCWILDTMED